MQGDAMSCTFSLNEPLPFILLWTNHLHSFLKSLPLLPDWSRLPDWWTSQVFNSLTCLSFYCSHSLTCLLLYCSHSLTFLSLYCSHSLTILSFFDRILSGAAESRRRTSHQINGTNEASQVPIIHVLLWKTGHLLLSIALILGSLLTLNPTTYLPIYCPIRYQATLGRYFVDIKQATIHYAHNFVDTYRLVKRDVPAHRNYSSYHGLDRAVQVSYREQKKVVRACNGIRRLQITPQHPQQ